MEKRLYNWQHPDWPKFTYDISEVQDLIYNFGVEAGVLLGGLSQSSEEIQNEAMIEIMANEGQKTSEIEGEIIPYEEIRSSIRNELGLGVSTKLKDLRALGIAKLMVSLRKSYQAPLTKEQLFAWHTMIFADEKQALGLNLGAYRLGSLPMQIISGPLGKETIHFEAPPSERVPKEMEGFIKWFNSCAEQKIPGLVRAAIAHIYFESIHPFDDGNGRIGRAICEKALAQEFKGPALISLSSAIQADKKEYYKELTKASRFDLNISEWIQYFVKTAYKSQQDAKTKIHFVYSKAKLWRKYGAILNHRQEKVVAKMLSLGPSGFKGNMTAGKYMKIAKCSKATATRDLSELALLGLFNKTEGGGRSTGYILNLNVKK